MAPLRQPPPLDLEHVANAEGQKANGEGRRAKGGGPAFAGKLRHGKQGAGGGEQKSTISHHRSAIRHPPSALGSDSLRRTLTTHWRVLADFSPDYILVAAMGYVAAGDPAGDVLREGTAARIAEAVQFAGGKTTRTPSSLCRAGADGPS